MNKGIKSIYNRIVLLAILLAATISVFSQNSQPFSINESPLPKPTSPVMDYVGVLNPATKSALEKKIIEFRDQTNPKVELAVVIVDTTGDRPIFDYSLAVYRGWGIGSKEGDNPGALLFIAVNDRKYFTQTGRNLEDELPDGVVGQIQRQYLVPALKKGDYNKGVSDTIDAYMSTIKASQAGEKPPVAANQKETQRENPRNSGAIGTSGCCLIIIFILIIIIFSRFGGGGGGRGGRRGSGWSGGGFGGSALPWVIGSVLSSGSSGSSSSDWGGSGGFGDSGGGGWGGFGGGGDAGGGGAGGDW